MIKFEHNNGDLRCAVFGGTFQDLCADLCLEMTLIYGSLYNHDKDLAKEFRRAMTMAMIDPDITGTIFSTEVVDSIKNGGQHICGSVSVKDPEEFKRQLEEILNENK